MFSEILFYQNHREYFSQVFKGQYIVIKDEALVGHFSTWAEACYNALRIFKNDNFLIKYCS